MVYTLTLNPALDYIMQVSCFEENKVNRAFKEDATYGGKGINVSAVLTNLGIPNVALGFIGGFSGKEVENLMHKDEINTDFIPLKKGSTRINIKIKSDKETDINASGPDITEDEVSLLFSKLKKFSSDDYVVLSGSIPSSLQKTFYCDIIKLLEEKNVKLIIDAEGETLTSTLKHKPFLIKPNHHELGGILKKELKSIEDVFSAGKEIQREGAQNVFVSMAEKGGLFLGENNEAFYAPAIKGNVVNSTGAGDSAVAGFIAEYIKTRNCKNAFVMGLCAGSASTFSQRLASKAEIYNLYDKFDFTLIKELKR